MGAWCMSRRPAEGQAEAMDVKRAREDGGADGAAPAGGNVDREHLFLTKVLQPSQPPADKLSLASVGNFLEAEAARLARANPAKGLEESLQFLVRGWRRSEEGGVVPSTWTGIAPLQEAILTTALSLVIAAQTAEKVRALSAVMELPVPARLLNELLSAASEDEAVPPQLLSAVCLPLKGRHLNDMRSSQFGKLIRLLRSSKRYPQALVSPPCLEELWKPVFEAKFVWRNRKKEVIAKQRPGNVLQTSSLLGWALAPTALDAASFPPSQSHLTEAGSTEWAEVRRVTRNRIEQLQTGTQMKLQGAQQQANELAEVMLRAGDGPRHAVLQWLGAVLASAEPRGKQGYIAPDGFNFWPQYGESVCGVLEHDQSPAFDKSLKNLLLLQALHARIQGFPTSGVALNTVTLLLGLCKPIKAEQASTISPFFAMREDIPEMLGNWQTEARFGETEQVAAAKELAKADQLFTVAAVDKTLFKTQIFWLTSKGLGTLLLPVAKEAFHCFQRIASVFYEKDPSVSDTAWREFLLAEAALKENGFLASLGHFVDLSFRFLQYVAAGGQEALPPPPATPAWHALPTTVLENVLDVCDLYRDRQKKGNTLPTGLFAHLDPNPILTTLCIVMASDGHVRDPSLRGRAVKLLHRLCFAFPMWQAKLNQPPLVRHFIPCLVGVFIAVEKAIMSYYDLSYRYKYELRMPVMDLFDLALQSEEHRKVLDDFSTGWGKERFIKLLTQLINDTNSQTEEAIRTLKEYHQHKNQAGAGGAGGSSSSSGGGAAPAPNHDEEVQDDDQTDGAEDIYRRSRMNYKEHAKKYFNLANKTWRTLWLLCKHCAPVVVEGKTVLEQLLHSSLDAQLHHLVGPEMKNIKGTQQEYEEIGFSPKDMMKQLTEIYLFLIRVDREEVIRIIAKDERYYSANTFRKAHVFAGKHSGIGGAALEEFIGFTKELADRVVQQRAAFDEADIPEEYLCEMMADIMSDPVQFPQSKKVVDRSTAERQIMGSDRDPYANTPVTVADLIPMPELKEKIHRFAKEKGIQLEGGNIFD